MSWRTISQYTFCSRTLRAISCANWDPKSRTRIRSWLDFVSTEASNFSTDVILPLNSQSDSPDLESRIIRNQPGLTTESVYGLADFLSRVNRGARSAAFSFLSDRVGFIERYKRRSRHRRGFQGNRFWASISLAFNFCPRVPKMETN